MVVTVPVATAVPIVLFPAFRRHGCTTDCATDRERQRPCIRRVI